MIYSIPAGNEKHVLSRIYTVRELINALEGVTELTQLENDDRITEKNKLVGTTEMIFDLNELDNTDNLEDGRPSNTLLTYHVTAYGDFTCSEPKTPQYKKLKNLEFTSTTLRTMDQKTNIMTDGPATTVVLHI